MRLLVDLSNLAYRAAYKLNLTHRGQNTNIIYGVLKSVESIALELEPDEVVICWDGGSQRRKEIFPGYKGDRQKDEEFVEDLQRQLAVLKRFFDCLPLIQCYETGVEADDVIAVLTKFLHLEEVGIVTSDSDLFQLSQAPKHHIVDPKKHSVVELEMEPAQFLTYRVLVGGKDNVPGVHMVGDKTARKLIGQFKTLKAILKHSKKEDGLGKMTHKQVKEVVSRNLKLWDLSNPQVTHDERVSILDQYRMGRLNRRIDTDSLHGLLSEFGFSSFIRRFSMFKGVFERMSKSKVTGPMRMSRGGSSEQEKAKADKRGSVDTKDQEGARYTKRLRAVASLHDGGKGKKKAPREGGNTRKETSPKVSRPRQGEHPRKMATRDGFICRIRKVEPPGLAVSGTSSSSQGAICTIESGSKKGTVDGRSFRIDLSDQGLPQSERVESARKIRRTETLWVLSTLAKGEGDEWIQGQSANRLRFVSRLIAKFESDENYVPTKKEHKACEVLMRDYTMEPPDWMKSIHDED